jgi:hypothetical protein
MESPSTFGANPSRIPLLEPIANSEIKVANSAGWPYTTRQQNHKKNLAPVANFEIANAEYPPPHPSTETLPV